MSLPAGVALLLGEIIYIRLFDYLKLVHMKKIALVFMLLAGFCSHITAQTATAKDAPKAKKNSSTEKTASTKQDITKSGSSQSGVTKAGDPDMRFKANKEAKAKQDAQPAQPSTTTIQPTPATSAKANPQMPAKSMPASAAADKVMGKDAKGRSIYQGPKGGQYIINANGNKEYIKKEQ